MHAPSTPVQRGRLHLSTIRTSFSFRSILSSPPVSRSSSLSHEPLSPTNTAAPAPTTHQPTTASFSPSNSCSSRTFSTSSTRSYRSVSPSSSTRSFSSRNGSVTSAHSLQLRSDLEEELSEERRLFGSQAVSMLEPRPSVVEAMGMEGLGMGTIDSLVWE